MSETEKQEMITQFCDVTGEPAERAEFYLSSANWMLQVGLCFRISYDFALLRFCTLKTLLSRKRRM